MTHAEHIAAARRTIKRARQADSAVLYAAKLLACECKRCRCNYCGNHPHKPGGLKEGRD
jgi:hypothetical protein